MTCLLQAFQRLRRQGLSPITAALAFQAPSLATYNSLTSRILPTSHALCFHLSPSRSASLANVLFIIDTFHFRRRKPHPFILIHLHILQLTLLPKMHFTGFIFVAMASLASFVLAAPVTIGTRAVVSHSMIELPNNIGPRATPAPTPAPAPAQ